MKGVKTPRNSLTFCNLWAHYHMWFQSKSELYLYHSHLSRLFLSFAAIRSKCVLYSSHAAMIFMGQSIANTRVGQRGTRWHFFSVSGLLACRPSASLTCSSLSAAADSLPGELNVLESGKTITQRLGSWSKFLLLLAAVLACFLF